MNAAPRQDRDPRFGRDLRRAIVPAARPNPLVAAWRWRYELALVLALSAIIATTVVSHTVLPMIIAFIAVPLTVTSWPTARRFVVDRAWCIITPHRVRVGCVEGLIYSSRGKIPVILWTSHQPFGERVFLWCRAGTSVDDFVLARSVLAAACWAEDVTVYFDIHRTHLVTLDVIRRPSGPISDLEDDQASDPYGPTAWSGDQDIQPS